MERVDSFPAWGEERDVGAIADGCGFVVARQQHPEHWGRRCDGAITGVVVTTEFETNIKWREYRIVEGSRALRR